MGDRLVGPPAPHIIETEIDDDISLYDPATEQVIVLNGTASDVWRLADGEMTIDGIVETLSKVYATPAGDIRGDVTRLIADLIQKGLLPAS